MYCIQRRQRERDWREKRGGQLNVRASKTINLPHCGVITGLSLSCIYTPLLLLLLTIPKTDSACWGSLMYIPFLATHRAVWSSGAITLHSALMRARSRRARNETLLWLIIYTLGAGKMLLTLGLSTSLKIDLINWRIDFSWCCTFSFLWKKKFIFEQ